MLLLTGVLNCEIARKSRLNGFMSLDEKKGSDIYVMALNW